MSNQDVADRIAAASASLDKALESPDAAAVASHFTEQGVLGESGLADVVGRAAITEFLAGANQKRRVIHHRLTRDELIVLGDRAIERARFAETKQYPGQAPVHEWGRVVTFWKRETDGAWRIEHLVVSDLPGPG
jgi:uncharacterized protein (TIGR02246 family)